MDTSCIECAYLSDCHQVTEQMIVEQARCAQFSLAPQGVLDARSDVIRECGAQALRYEIPKRKTLSTKPKARRRRQHA